MELNLQLYNTLSRKKEAFQPINPPFVGLYLCGPTVYGHGHLGHARPSITFDVLIRYLKFKGAKVRYVRNITDVGHLERDADEGEDKIGKAARVAQVEPMEIAQYYAHSYHQDMEALNVLPPSIEPLATGHIVEQIALTQEILNAGFAYESNGSIYFDYEKYAKEGKFGALSGRIFEDAQAGSRELDGQSEKRNPQDFALWKKASDYHIMRWPSPWGDGFPGWHLECSAMSAKYLGDEFDIHGGGLDLLFPHHECEIAQHQASKGKNPARYWMHINMLTINGQKMGKSLGNNINLKEFFSGEHPFLKGEAFSPMTIRFFMLQAHYRSTLDFSPEALRAAKKSYRKVMNGVRSLANLALPAELTAAPSAEALLELEALYRNFFEALDDDLNTAVALAELFQMIKKINAMENNPALVMALGAEGLNWFKGVFPKLIFEVLGLKEEASADAEFFIADYLKRYREAKLNRDFAIVDEIRAVLKQQGILIKDGKAGITWSFEE